MTAIAVQRFTPPRVVPSGNECWWTLGPNIRDRYRTAKDRGIRHVLDVGGGRCALVLASGFTVHASSLEFQVDWEFSIDVGVTQVREGVRSVDVLCTHPPFLPTRTDWQQMTRRGEREHPGRDMRNWRYDNPW